MLSTELSNGAALIAMALSVVAFIAAYGCFHFTKQIRDRGRDYRNIILAITELDDRLVALQDSHKRLRSRVGMRELRAKRKGATDEFPDEPAANNSHHLQTPENVEDWKKKMRLKLHRGELKP